MNDEPIKNILTVSSSPHIRSHKDVSIIMLIVTASLGPAVLASVLFFGFRSLLIICTSIIFAVASEAIVTKIMRKPNSIGDFSAILSGILLALNLPPTIPLWMAALGSVFAIVVAKQAFGGLGHNFVNPALAGRAFLLASFPSSMTCWTAPNGLIKGTLNGLTRGIDAIAQATPLAYFKEALGKGLMENGMLKEAIPHLFWGNVGGCIGETSAFALLIGGIFLACIRLIDVRIPLIYIGTVFGLFWIFNGSGQYFSLESFTVPLFQILSGGLMLGAWFMATDYVTAPIMPVGKCFFALGCGVLTFVIRKFGGYPEGVCYSILIMNIASALFDRYFRPKRYGEVKRRARIN